MKFEYDEKKSQINKEKHGIDFVEAQKLWQDEEALVIPANIVDWNSLCSHLKKTH